jgi:hypothetical protein
MNVSDFSVGSIQNGWNGNLANEIGHDFRPRALSRGANKQARAAHHRRVMEAGRLIADVMSGKVNPIFLQEAMQPSDQIFVDWMRENYPGIYPQGSFALQETMSVTDYQALFVDVLDRLYYSYFNGFPVVNMPVVRFHDLRDFRLVSRYLLDGLVTPFTQMDAAAPPPAQSLSGPVPQNDSTFPTTNTAPIQYQPKLAQAMASVNWRATINDDLGIFRDIPKRLSISANRGITYFIHQLYMGATDLNATLFAAGYGNRITTANGGSSDNPTLGAQGIMDAWKILAGMLDSSGQPIMLTGRVKIVYGPSQYAVAKNLQNMLSNHTSIEGGSQNSDGFPTNWIETNGWVAENIDWIMDPYIRSPFTNKPNAWLMFLDPELVERPAIEFGVLQGFRTPQLFQRVPNTQRVGGGVEPAMGDFLTMDNDMKIVSVFGGTQIEGRVVVGSNGSGS